MDPPSSQILLQLGLPYWGWSMPLNHGIVAETWVGHGLVLQARPIYSAERILMIYHLSKDLDLPGLQFQSKPLVENSHGVLRDAYKGCGGERIWTIQPRLLETHLLYRRDMDNEDILRHANQVLPQVVVQLSDFAEQVEHHKLLCQIDTPGVSIQKASLEVIRQLARQHCPLPVSPLDHLPPLGATSPLVASHGDAILKNTLATQGGTFLIDWEAATVLPRHMDFSHWTAFLCKYSPPDIWPEIISHDWNVFQDHLSGWSYRDWQVAVAWYMARELIRFPNSRPEDALRFWAGLDRFARDLSGETAMTL